MLWPRFVWCDCGLAHWSNCPNTAYSALSRCRSQHIDPSVLQLSTANATLRNVMFVIFSHSEAEHNHKAVKKELLAAGVPSDQLFVKYGYAYPECYHAGFLVSHTKICMYSYKYRILPFIHETLQCHARKPAAVIVFENNVIASDCSIAELLKTINNAPAASSIVWPGFIKVHGKGSVRWRWKPYKMIQGSKVIAYRGDGLVHLHTALVDVKALNRYGHFDLWMSRALGMRKIYYPATSLYGVRRHSSVCSSKDGKAVKKKRLLLKRPAGR